MLARFSHRKWAHSFGPSSAVFLYAFAEHQIRTRAARTQRSALMWGAGVVSSHTPAAPQYVSALVCTWAPLYEAAVSLFFLRVNAVPLDGLTVVYVLSLRTRLPATSHLSLCFTLCSSFCLVHYVAESLPL